MIFWLGDRESLPPKKPSRSVVKFDQARHRHYKIQAKKAKGCRDLGSPSHPARSSSQILHMNPINIRSGEFARISPPVTPRMVRSRTVELAISAGRSPIEIKQSDYEQAKRELTGETDFERQLAVLHPGR